jgi:hypothetical protein
METHRFYKDGISWYIDLPSYLEQGGSLGDLQMVDGADKMLDIMAGNEQDVVIQISTEPFQGADVLVMTEKCDPYIGGAYYLLKHFEGQEINRNMWLCGVTEFVFGYLPERIYVKRTDGVDKV